MTEQECIKIIKEATSLQGKLYGRDQLRKLRMVTTIRPEQSSHRVYNKPHLEIKWWLQEQEVYRLLKKYGVLNTYILVWAVAGVVVAFLCVVSYAYFMRGI